MKKYIYIIFPFLLLSCSSYKQTEVLVIGGGASGTTAGIQSARMGVNTLIVEESSWLGGMLTSAGVSAIDGNHKLPGGLWGEFRAKLIQYYGSEEKLNTGWVSKVLFEPSAGNKIWQDMVAAESLLDVRFNTKVDGITRKDNYWLVNIDHEGRKETIKAAVLIDGTELGDVAKACGATYDIGMDAREVCEESIAGEKANDIIQDLTLVAVLKDYGKDVTIKKPEGYDPSYFYCSCKVPQCTNPKEGKRVWDCQSMLNYGKLPNNKYMINWPIEGNDYYLNLIEMTPEQRTEALKVAKNFTMCFVYYMQTELGFNTLGLADDEFPTADRLPFIPYHRESRRIHGLVRFNLNHVSNPFTQSEKLYRTNIAVGDYPVDHHHARYQDWSNLPDLHFYPIPSYGLPLGALIPKDVKGLIVAEKSISVSNLINGTTRLQPVVMQIGQAAGALGALAVQHKEDVDKVSVREVQQAILNAGGYLQPYLDLQVSDPHFKSLQRIGSTGILRGRGLNVGWENQTWFDADSLLYEQALTPGLKEFAPEFEFSVSNEIITIEEALNIVYWLARHLNVSNVSDEATFDARQKANWKQLQGSEYDIRRPVTRKEFAVLLDAAVNPFELYSVTMKGELGK
jgi:hypothetical protein|nr:FAD-dependent oxidoreductase [uncultured Macellibacteroides sp.]